MAKPIDKLSAREIETLSDKRYALVSANTRALINAGFGNSRGNEIRAMDHPLADEYRRVNDSWQEVVSEMESRKRYSGTLKPIKRASSLY